MARLPLLETLASQHFKIGVPYVCFSAGVGGLFC